MNNFSEITPNKNSDGILKKLPSSVKVFCVGGAVRDTLLNKKNADRDYLLVGADANLLIKIGFISVGNDFPVFLHPISKEEFALARTEKKKGRGHKAFVFNSSKTVSLKDDLKRRDFTINSMAIDESGKLIDFFSGKNDLEKKIFKHIGPEFSEDPLRLLRLARFLSVFPEFNVHPSTVRLCEDIVKSKEILNLSKERIWGEFVKGLIGKNPLAMTNFLVKTGTWALISKENKLSDHVLNLLKRATESNLSEFWKVAIIFLDCDNEKIHCLIPKEVKTCKKILNEFIFLLSDFANLKKNQELFCKVILHFFEHSDFHRKPERFDSLLKLMPSIYENNNFSDLNIDSKILKNIIYTLVKTSLNMVVKNAAANKKPIKSSIQAFRVNLIKKILKQELKS
ncbi:MAG: hypothetical protein CBD16_08610 [Betaproteobacteria bacterium TMED156]|nr:MAG: hypothetical protein CBD16_08610 [Betaproteobacteria bacterium TMED156]